jgi:peptide/nickel transport system permease protein
MLIQDTVQAETSARADRIPRPSGWAQVLELLAHDKAASFSLVYLLVVVAAALLSPVLLGPSSMKMDLSMRLIPPTLAGGHLFGTDQLGRDLVGRILMASRVSLATAFIVVALSLSFGVLLGIVAGYYGGWFDDVIMRVIDVAMGFPSLLLALVVIYALGPSIVNVILVLAATRWMLYARVARAETLKLRRFQYVDAGRTIGGTDAWILRKHILPNLICVTITLATLELATVILAESALSFLGLGVQPPDASLGLLIAQGKEYITTAWLGIALDPVQRWRLTSARRAR